MTGAQIYEVGSKELKYRNTASVVRMYSIAIYRAADKSLARPGRKNYSDRRF
jgi:hypothetical protein